MESIFSATSVISSIVKTLTLTFKKKYSTFLSHESTPSALLARRLIKIQQEYHQLHAPQLSPKKISLQIQNSTKKYFFQFELNNQHYFKCQNFFNHLWLQLCNRIRILQFFFKRIKMLFWGLLSYKKLMFKRKKLIRRKRQNALKRFIQDLEDLEKKFHHHAAERSRQTMLEKTREATKLKPVKPLTFTQNKQLITKSNKQIPPPIPSRRFF